LIKVGGEAEHTKREKKASRKVLPGFELDKCGYGEFSQMKWGG